MQAGNPPPLVILPKRRKQRPARYRRLADRQVHAHLVGLFKDHFQKVRCPRIGRDASIRRRPDLQFGLPYPGWQHAGLNRFGGILEHHPRRCQVVGEAVLHQIVVPDPGCMQEPPQPPPVPPPAARFIDRTRRLEDMGDIPCPHPPERRLVFLPSDEIGFAQHRQLRQIGNRLDLLRTQKTAIPLTPDQREDITQVFRKVSFPFVSRAGFKRVVIRHMFPQVSA